MQIFVFDLEPLAVAADDFYDTINEFCIKKLPLPGVPDNSFLSLTDIASKKSFGRSWKNVCRYVKKFSGDQDPVLVSHNARNDVRILLLELNRADSVSSIANWRFACSIEVIRECLPLNSYSLQSLCEKFNVPNEKPHEALSDTSALIGVIRKPGLYERFPQQALRCAKSAEEVYKRPTSKYAWIANSKVYHLSALPCQYLAKIKAIESGCKPPADKKMCTCCCKLKKKNAEKTPAPPRQFWCLATSRIFHNFRDCNSLKRAKSAPREMSEKECQRLKLCKNCHGRSLR